MAAQLCTITMSLIPPTAPAASPAAVPAPIPASPARSASAQSLSTHPGIIVLKLGGSVLASDAALPIAVHEIDRHLRQGLRIVAVVSAIGDTTDDLLARARSAGGINTSTADADSSEPDTSTLAALLATGEHTSAALLTLALRRAGISASTLSVDQLHLVASGDVLDAEPQTIDTATIHAALKLSSVVVVPGFLARLPDGGPCTLGRGGSDLTALFIAQRLGVPVRLAKDVDALYQWDPALEKAGKHPLRYNTLTTDDALQLDGDIVQHKAVRFAKRTGLRFTVGAINRDDGTIIGAPVTTFADYAQHTPPLRIGLLGLGTVGRGVASHLAQLPQFAELVAVAVRDPQKHTDFAARSLGGLTLSADALAVAASGVDVLIDTTDDPAIALAAAKAALACGTTVITASKQLAVQHAGELQALARANGARFVFSASVGGAVPVLETIAALRAGGERITAVRGVLNATSNLVLTQLEHGWSLAEAIKLAQSRNLTEREPADDLSGLDVARKLAIIARQAFGVELDPQTITRTGIAELSPLQAAASARAGTPIRLIGTVERAPGGAALSPSAGSVIASVSLEVLDAANPLATARGPENVVQITIEHSPRPTLLRGAGAGRWAVAQSIIGDVLAIARTRGQSGRSASTEPRVQTADRTAELVG